MDKLLSSRPVAITLSILMVIVGLTLAYWAISNVPGRTSTQAVDIKDNSSPVTPERSGSTSGEESADETSTETPGSSDTHLTPPQAEIDPQVLITLGAGVPVGLSDAVHSFTISHTGYLTATTVPVSATLQLDIVPVRGKPVYTEIFAAAARFDQPQTDLTWSALRNSWRGRDGTFETAVVLSDTLPTLIQALGDPGENVIGVATVDEVVDAAWLMTSTVALLPFDQLTPSLTVLPIDGQTPIENGAQFDGAGYPLAATIYAHITGDREATEAKLEAMLNALPESNRMDDRLTVVAMTGVTAMVRRTAEQMDERGAAWPAEIVGPDLAAADITHISNEVPFVEGCETNTDLENLTFCSKFEYLEALTATGVDIIGLTGNHQNDYGYDAALKSLEFYAEVGLPVYGGGETKEAAFAPLIIEHNGNRLAFVGANAFGPQLAWATDIYPGSAPFDLSILSATVRNLHAKDLADVVLVELQYVESYSTEPLFDQRTDFNALSRAGADIVTGVQSHVAQGMEFNDGKIILYGLGNLFFDQMSSDEVRQGLIIKHTIYDGTHISTQLLPTVLEDFGQPRWATAEERTAILERVFDASTWEY